MNSGRIPHGTGIEKQFGDMNGPEINERAFRFACRMVELYQKLRRAGGAAWELAPQLLDAGTSIGANLEEATGGQTKPDLIHKNCVALKEAREVRFWLRVIDKTRLLPGEDVTRDIQEASELANIVGAIIRNARLSSDRG
jgi:four helix bundle protein